MKKIICTILTALCLFCTAAVAASAENIALTDGEIITFGSYPQAQVTDSAITEALNDLIDDTAWNSLKYYSRIAPEDSGFYQDIVYGGEKYRAFYMAAYRPTVANDSWDSGWQKKNGYETDTVYWFLFEPIEWQVIDAANGRILAVNALDSRSVNDFAYTSGSEKYADSGCTCYLSDYSHSALREWLNDDFYNTAFSDAEKAMINISEVETKAYSSASPKYDGETTSDKIFIPSYDELTSAPASFSKKKAFTDYMMSQGYANYISVGGNFATYALWYLRSAKDSGNMAYIKENGSFASDSILANGTDTGIVPCMSVTLVKEDPKPDLYADLTFDYADDILTIGGSGIIPDPAASSTAIPEEYKNANAVILDGSVSGIASDAFAGFTELETLIINTPVEIAENAFADSLPLTDIICRGSVVFADHALADTVSAELFLKDTAAAETGKNDITAHRYSFADGTLSVSGSLTMDSYRLFDLITAMCMEFADINYISFDGFISEDLTFTGYDAAQERYVPIPEQTLTNVRFSVKVFGEEDLEQITFNEMSRRAAEGTLDQFYLITTADGWEEIRDTGMELKEETFTGFILKALKFIVTLLNKLFNLLSRIL